MALDCVMKCPHTGYQKCIAILRVTLLRNHMSIELIFVTYNPTNFLEKCQHSQIKSPPRMDCLLQSVPSTPCWGGAVSLKHMEKTVLSPKIPNTSHGTEAWTSQQRPRSPTFSRRSDSVPLCAPRGWEKGGRRKRTEQGRETRKKEGKQKNHLAGMHFSALWLNIF